MRRHFTIKILRQHIENAIQYYMDFDSFNQNCYAKACCFYEVALKHQKRKNNDFKNQVKELGESLNMLHEKFGVEIEQKMNVFNFI